MTERWQDLLDMLENPPKLPPGIVEESPPDNESRYGRDLGTGAKVTWSWLKSKFSKMPSRDEYTGGAYDGKWGRLYISVRPFDVNGQWLDNLLQEFTSSGLKDAQRYGFEIMRDTPEVQGFWLSAKLEKYWTNEGSFGTKSVMDLGRYEREPLSPKEQALSNANARGHQMSQWSGGPMRDRAACVKCGDEMQWIESAWGKGHAEGRAAYDRKCSGDASRYAPNPRKRTARPFLDGPRGTERELAKLRRDQEIVARQLQVARDPEKVAILQDRERDLQRRVDRLVFGDEQVANGNKFYRLGMAPYVPVLSGLIFDNRSAAARRASQENKFGEFRGRGVKVYPCDASGNFIIKSEGGSGHTPNHATVHYNLVQLGDDIGAALDHMSDFDVHLDKSNISVTEPTMIRMRDLGQYDDLSGWLELDSGADEQDIRSFRGPSWAEVAEQWTSPEQMPPIVIVEAPNAVAIADGRGRVNYATAMGWDEIPAVIVTPALASNHAAVHYVWLIDYRGVPMDTEGPYGPMSLARAEAFARIGAKEGDHDRVVSIGADIMSDGFEIVRRYRRDTGERIL